MDNKSYQTDKVEANDGLPTYEEVIAMSLQDSQPSPSAPPSTSVNPNSNSVPEYATSNHL